MTEWTQTKHHSIEANQDGRVRINGNEVRSRSPVFWYERTSYDFGKTIWEAFNGPVPPDKMIRFKDGNRANRALSNLALEERRRLHYRVTAQDRALIIKRHKKGEDVASLAECFELSVRTIHGVINEHFRS